MYNEQSFADSILSNTFNGLDVSNVENLESVNAMLDQFGLRWRVEKEPFILETGEKTGFYGIVRQDTKKTFSTCKETYQPYQNSEMAELLHRIAQKAGYTIHSGGSLNGGAKVYLQLNTGTEIKGLGKNGTTVKGYVTGLNTHDGTRSFGFGSSNITVCCANTFAMAMKQVGFIIRHTGSMYDRIESALRQINGVVEIEKTMFEQFITLSEIAVSPVHIAEIVRAATDVDITMKASEAKETVSTYALNRSQELLTSIDREMNQKGQTLWGLFSGVTHYTTHKLPVPKRENARVESKLVGSGQDIDNVAFSQVLAFAGIGK